MPPRCGMARTLVAGLPPEAVVLPVQVVGELQRVLTGRLRRPADEARNSMLRWADVFQTADT